MRLTDDEVILLKQSLSSLSGEAQLYLFGSRVDDDKRGGDIDLLIVSSHLTKRDLRQLRIDFCRRFGDQKLDVVLDDGAFNNVFHQMIREKAVLL